MSRAILVASQLPCTALTWRGENSSRVGVRSCRCSQSKSCHVPRLLRGRCWAGPSSSESVGATSSESTRLQLSESEVSSLKERFRMADVDGNGRIDLAELRALLESVEGGKVYLLVHWLPETEVEEMMKLYDTDGSGDISFDEFGAFLSDDRLLNGTLSEYQEAFRAADTSGDGKIGFSELSRLLKNLGQEVSDAKLTEVFNKYDLDASGQIEFNEFLLMFRDKLLNLREVLDYIRLTPRRADGEAAPTLVDLGPGGLVTTVFGEEELDDVLGREKSKLVVLFSGLSWCRPCKAAAKPYTKLAERYRSTVFLKVLGNANASTKHLFKNRLEVKATPAFYFFRDGKVVDSHTGASKQKLETNLIKNLRPEERPAEGPVLIEL